MFSSGDATMVDDECLSAAIVSFVLLLKCAICYQKELIIIIREFCGFIPKIHQLIFSFIAGLGLPSLLSDIWTYVFASE